MADCKERPDRLAEVAAHTPAPSPFSPPRRQTNNNQPPATPPVTASNTLPGSAVARVHHPRDLDDLVPTHYAHWPARTPAQRPQVATRPRSVHEVLRGAHVAAKCVSLSVSHPRLALPKAPTSGGFDSPRLRPNPARRVRGVSPGLLAAWVGELVEVPPWNATIAMPGDTVLLPHATPTEHRGRCKRASARSMPRRNGCE